MASKKILIISHKPPYPKVDGGSIAIAQVLEALLEQGFHVTYLCMETDKHLSRNSITNTNLNFKAIYVNTQLKIASALKNIFTKQSYILSRFNQNIFREALKKILKTHTFDTILFESLFTSVYLNTLNELSNAKKLYRAHNIEHHIWLEQSNQSNNILKKWYLKIQAERLKNEEIKFWNNIDSILSISENDRSHIIKQCPTPTYTLGLHIEKKHILYNDQSTKVDFFHLGAMDWIPNQDGMNWILKDVFPKVKQTEKSSEIHLAGRAMPNKLKTHIQDGYYNHGEVSNAIDFMSKHKVMLVPLFTGSGIRVKIIEGMSLGKCIISTKIGVKGINCTNNKNILIANSENEFIKAMCFCIQNPDKVNEIGNEAKKYARENFSKEHITNELKKII
tara:strand:- start:3014 stop:4189 length:1176 start_codon:yes stop_codon:yes gene_type:complete